MRFSVRQLIGVLLFTAVCHSSVAQEGTSAPTNAATPAMQDMTKRMMPGEGHKPLARMIGKWQGKLRVWSSAQPDAPPIESDTAAECRFVLGGRFVLEEANGMLMRMPMQRMSILGFDNLTQRYTLTFYSSFDTATNTATGTADETGRIITLRGEFDEPEGKAPFKNVIRMDQDDVHIFESYRIMPDGRELKLVEQVMTRVP